MLHRMGYRFRVHYAKLPGKPDIVLPKHRTVILVHGCFWHRHPGCKYAYSPKSSSELWQKKFVENTERDKAVGAQLEGLGWQVVVVWECQTNDTSLPTLEHLLASIGRTKPDDGRAGR